MPATFGSIDEAFAALGDPSAPAWGAAFAYLSARPETAQTMLEAFAETLEQLGVAPTGTDPETGEPGYRLQDIATAMGVTEADLDAAIADLGAAEPPA